jgi:hypothetical protein
MSKVMRLCFGFTLLRFLFSTETLAPLPHPITSKTNQSWRTRARFPALHADHVCLLWDFIGWLDCLCLFWSVTSAWVVTFNWKSLYVVFLTKASGCILTIFNYLCDLYGKITSFGFTVLTSLSLGQYRKTAVWYFSLRTGRSRLDSSLLFWSKIIEAEGVKSPVMYVLFKFVSH